MSTKAVAVAAPVAADVFISPSRFAALAEQAKVAAASERPNISKINLKAGQITVGGVAVENNKLEAVILAATYRNTFYKGRYDPNNIVNPNCFALSETDDDVVPSPDVTTPEHPTCEGCPRAEWGSDLNGGRGKACKQTRRLVLLPANALESPDTIKIAELAIVDVPVTSVKNYSQYINVLSASIGLPAWAVVTEMSTKPDAKTQFKVEFKGIKAAGGDAVIDALEIRKVEAVRIGLIGYDASNDEEPEKQDAPAKKVTKKVTKKF